MGARVRGSENAPDGRAPVDGVIKYKATHVFEPLPATPELLEALAALDDARTFLHRAGFIGVDATGTGYGNLSVRLPSAADAPSFLISGSGTGKEPVLGAAGYCRVLACDADANTVISAGPVRASSESMSHDAVYRANSSIRFVAHAHHAELFAALLRENGPRTPASVAYGTPEMARAVVSLVRAAGTADGLFVSAGHADGLFSYGADLGRTVNALVEVYKRCCGKPMSLYHYISGGSLL